MSGVSFSESSASLPHDVAGRDAESAVQSELTIRTSEEGWFARLAQAYREKRRVLLIDDARVGVDPATQSLAQMGWTARLVPQEWGAVGISLGMTGIGVALVAAAVFDPEPTSKLGLLVGGGVACVLTGGFSAVRILTKQKPPSIRVSPRGLEIEWL